MRSRRTPDYEGSADSDFGKKNKKMVFLARTVYSEVRKGNRTNGTSITNEILPKY